MDFINEDHCTAFTENEKDSISYASIAAACLSIIASIATMISLTWYYEFEEDSIISFFGSRKGSRIGGITKGKRLNHGYL
jgi:hypothetical protein